MLTHLDDYSLCLIYDGRFSVRSKMEWDCRIREWKGRPQPQTKVCVSTLPSPQPFTRKQTMCLSDGCCVLRGLAAIKFSIIKYLTTSAPCQKQLNRKFWTPVPEPLLIFARISRLASCRASEATAMKPGVHSVSILSTLSGPKFIYSTY